MAEMRDLIHADYPFTEQENSAAWILAGIPADQAVAASAQLRVELSEPPNAVGSERLGGWRSVPRVHWVGDFRALINLVADIQADGTLLGSTAREDFLNEWTTRVSADEAEKRIDQLEHLGRRWTEKRGTFRRLLTLGRL